MGAGRLQMMVVPRGTGGSTVVEQKSALRTQGADKQNSNAGGRSSVASGPRVWNCSSVWHKVGVPAATVFNTRTCLAHEVVCSLSSRQKKTETAFRFRISSRLFAIVFLFFSNSYALSFVICSLASWFMRFPEMTTMAPPLSALSILNSSFLAAKYLSCSSSRTEILL
jgi:hypothetical protein